MMSEEVSGGNHGDECSDHDDVDDENVEFITIDYASCCTTPTAIEDDSLYSDISSVDFSQIENDDTDYNLENNAFL